MRADDPPPGGGAGEASGLAPAVPPSGTPGRFTEGSTMRHVVEMTVTGSIGLIAIFVVDFLSLFYVSRLGEVNLTAGVGYATTVLYLAMSFNIGAMIAVSAVVSRAIGARDRPYARRLTASGITFMVLIGLAVSGLILAALGPILDQLGAQGVARETALRFLWITLPANVLMAAGMGLSGVLRGVGDAQRAMRVTLYGGIATAILDPILIFGFDLGVDGAAIATVISRLVFAGVGLHGVLVVHNLLARPRLAHLRADYRPLSGIAGPAILTQVATPVAGIIFVMFLAPFGEAAIAANAIIERLVPLAFGVIFALSGSVGPIFGQNLGARRFDRLHQTLRDGLTFAMLYSLVAWLLLVAASGYIGPLFGVSGATEAYVRFFCYVGGLAWLFNGFLFVANAAFNNLGFPFYSTAFNWGRATIGTVPFAWAGVSLGGVEGMIVGVAIGSLLFGLSAIFVAFRAINRIAEAGRKAEAGA